ncbi:hypothetical protein ACWCQQ_09080 [Streptomyces sp. NPDC002143]
MTNRLRVLAVGALLAMSATACGSGGGDSGSGSKEASAPSAGGLPSASDMASIAAYLNKYTSCQDLATGDDYDADHDENRAWGADEAVDASWAIKERGVCMDGSNRPIALLVVSDMAKFQAAAKTNSDEFLVGEDFAVVPVGDETARSLLKSDLRFLTCDADFSAPSGFEKEPGLVDGCVLTNYVPE